MNTSAFEKAFPAKNLCPKCKKKATLDSKEVVDFEYVAWYMSCESCQWQWDLVCSDPYIENEGPLE